ARRGLSARRAAVIEVAECAQTQLDDPMAGATFHVHHERHATGVVFETGVVEATGARLLVHRLLSHSLELVVAGDGAGPAAVPRAYSTVPRSRQELSP